MKKYEHIDFKPPVSVAKTAEKGLKYREMAGGKGGLTVEQAKAEGIGSGVQRAVNLKNRDTMSPETVKRMKAFFDRHQKNKAIDPKHKDEPWKDRGYVAWLIWGGDPGYAWARKVVDQMEKADRMGKKIAARFLKLSQEHGRSPKQIQDDNAIEWAKDLAELNKELMKMPGGKTNPESGRTLNQGLKSSEMLFRRMNLNQAAAEDVKAALEMVFEKVKYVDKDIVDYVKQKRKIDWKPKGKVSADMAMKVVARFTARIEREAGLGSFLKNIVTKIPGLPSKQEALKTVSDFMRKNPAKFEKVLEGITEQIESVPEGKTAFDVKGLIRNLKGLADPKVILAMIALMGAFNTADAGVFKRMVEKRQEQTVKKDVTQDFKGQNQIADAFLEQNKGAMSGTVMVGGNEYGIGISIDNDARSPQFAKTDADTKAAKALPGGKVFKRIAIQPSGGGFGILTIVQK